MREGKYVVVHVDDSPTARELLKETFSEPVFELISAEHASDLETRVLSDPSIRGSVDMFVLDMEMPDMLGAQVGAVVHALYEELASTPFIIYSGKEKDWVEQMSKEVAEFSEGFRNNHKGYVMKGPGSEDLVVAKVKEVLGMG